MIYSKAAAHFSKALEEMVDVNAEKPWEEIETELKKAIMGDKTALEQVALMSDGILFSLSVATAMAKSASEQEEQERIARMGMLDVISTSMLRAFAMGVHCQKAVAEVETLETLVKQ